MSRSAGTPTAWDLGGVSCDSTFFILPLPLPSHSHLSLTPTPTPTSLSLPSHYYPTSLPLPSHFPPIPFPLPSNPLPPRPSRSPPTSYPVSLPLPFHSPPTTIAPPSHSLLTPTPLPLPLLPHSHSDSLLEPISRSDIKSHSNSMGLVARRADDLPVWVLSVAGSRELRRTQRVLELCYAPKPPCCIPLLLPRPTRYPSRLHTLHAFTPSHPFHP